MTLATADGDGRPWVSPVWFATINCREFLWVSSPDARHSRNVVARPEIAIVVFDSTVEPGAAQAVYLSAIAELVPEADLDRAVALYSDLSQQQGLAAWSRDDVIPPARHRIYRAAATEHFVLTDSDERVPIDLAEE
jgi:pyridoxine/pyridoxamine 5'-phosphate oxidase